MSHDYTQSSDAARCSMCGMSPLDPGFAQRHNEPVTVAVTLTQPSREPSVIGWNGGASSVTVLGGSPTSFNAPSIVPQQPKWYRRTIKVNAVLYYTLIGLCFVNFALGVVTAILKAVK